MRRAARTSFLTAAFLFLAIAALADDAVELVDQTGAVLRVEQPVERLVSVYGAGTFYVYTLGAADRLVMAWYIGVKGIESAWDAMFRLEPRLRDLLAFGDPNVEEIVAREAQLVMVDGSRHSAFADQMADLGVPVIRYLVESPEELKEALLLTGRALGSDALARAERFVADYDRVMGAVASALEQVPRDDRVRVLFLGTAPLLVASGEMYQTHLIEAAGGVSVSRELLGYWREVNLEQVLVWDPDVILIPPYGALWPEEILANADWAPLRAVQAGRVHRMPRVIAPMDAPVPESLLAVAWMAQVFYPNLPDLNLAAEVDRFYTSYYGYDLTEAERAALAGR